MVHFNPSIEQQKQVYDCKTKDEGVVYDERKNLLRVFTGACTWQSR